MIILFIAILLITVSCDSKKDSKSESHTTNQPDNQIEETSDASGNKENPPSESSEIVIEDPIEYPNLIVTYSVVDSGLSFPLTIRFVCASFRGGAFQEFDNIEEFDSYDPENLSGDAVCEDEGDSLIVDVSFLYNGGWRQAVLNDVIIGEHVYFNVILNLVELTVTYTSPLTAEQITLPLEFP